MTTATCGVPVTVTGSENSTTTRMASPAMNNSPSSPCPVPGSARPMTVGTAVSAPSPSTVKPGSAATAKVPRSRAAGLPVRSWMVPPARVSAEAARPTPSESASARTTV